MKRSFAYVISCLLLLGLISPILAQQPTSQQAQPLKQEVPPISVQNVKGNIYQLKGGMGANTGFFIGEKEVLAIDAKMTEDAAKQMIVEIKKLTPHPISYITLTHSDGDHVNGLVGFPQGTNIISHEKTRAHMDKAFQSVRERAYLPNITFSEKLSLYLGGILRGTRIDLFYFGPAHTDGDAIVYFPNEKVAFIGDLLFIGRDPLIHRHKNGSSFGLVKVLKAILNLDAEIFVHGHGDLATKKDILSVIQSVEEKQIRIQALLKEGKDLEHVKKIFNIEDRPGGMRWMSLVEIIYLELTEKR
ncbi:MAG: MBL fold metallo-hydrolase [Thermodesulfobacteriota bacterium]|jgi:glyoxylase-like metal-dependent hydrolase (beta-lactamase superfamily II)